MIHLAVGQSIDLRTVGPPGIERTAWSCSHPALRVDCVSENNIRITAIAPGQAILTASCAGQAVCETVVVDEVPLRLEIVPEGQVTIMPNSFAWWGTPAAVAVYARQDGMVSA